MATLNELQASVDQALVDAGFILSTIWSDPVKNTPRGTSRGQFFTKVAWSSLVYATSNQEIKLAEVQVTVWSRYQGEGSGDSYESLQGWVNDSLDTLVDAQFWIDIPEVAQGPLPEIEQEDEITVEGEVFSFTISARVAVER